MNDYYLALMFESRKNQTKWIKAFQVKRACVTILIQLEPNGQKQCNARVGCRNGTITVMNKGKNCMLIQYSNWIKTVDFLLIDTISIIYFDYMSLNESDQHKEIERSRTLFPF